MKLQNIFTPESTKESLDRLNKLKANTVPEWGKMNASQMLAHLNVAYDITYGKKEAKNNFFSKMMLKMFVKSTVVGNKPYKKNTRTAPIFIIDDERDFEKEKALLIANIKKTEEKGTPFFHHRESPSFGKLSAAEWSNQFYKHMDHHFRQFGI